MANTIVAWGGNSSISAYTNLYNTRAGSGFGVGDLIQANEVNAAIRMSSLITTAIANKLSMTLNAGSAVPALPGSQILEANIEYTPANPADPDPTAVVKFMNTNFECKSVNITTKFAIWNADGTTQLFFASANDGIRTPIISIAGNTTNNGWTSTNTFDATGCGLFGVTYQKSGNQYTFVLYLPNLGARADYTVSPNTNAYAFFSDGSGNLHINFTAVDPTSPISVTDVTVKRILNFS